MTDQQIEKSKNFEQKILNRSYTDLLFYDKLADRILSCFDAEAKPNTLSFWSCLPLLILAMVVNGPSSLAYLFTGICLFIHQLLDIANKKQAYRLSKFSLATYYVDHFFDSISCICIGMVMGSLLNLSKVEMLTVVYFYCIVPFYLRHLSMYNGDYMVFQCISPASQGLLLLELLCLVGTFWNGIFSFHIGSMHSGHLLLILLVPWLLYHVFTDLKQIVTGKRIVDHKDNAEQTYPLKNVFALVVLGYIIMEVISIHSHLLEKNTLYLKLIFIQIMIIFGSMINNMVLSYGLQHKYRQISFILLLGLSFVVIFYGATVIISLVGSELSPLVANIGLGVAAMVGLALLVRDVWKQTNRLTVN